MLFVEIIVKNLRRRWTRTAMTVLALAVAVTATTTLWHLAWGYADSASDFYSSRGVDIVVVRAGVANRLTSSLRMDFASRLKSLPGVEDVDGSLTEMVSIGNAILIGIPMRGLAPEGFTIAKLLVGEGRPLGPDDRGTILIGSGIAAALSKRPGEPLDIEGKQFRIAGVTEASNPFDANSIVAPLADVQTLMGRQGIISELQVRATKSVRDDESLRSLCSAIEALQDDQHQPLGLKAQPTHQFVSKATEEKLGSAMAWAITAIVILLSLVGILNTMLMSVIERTEEIGLLRALGWKKKRVLQMILGESVAISLAGAILGVLVSWVLIHFLANWSRTSLLVPPDLSAAAWMSGFAVAIVAGIAGALYPASYAARMLPIESLHHE